MAKTIIITFRATPWQLAKALEGLRNYDKGFQPESLALLGKRTFEHGVNYLTQALAFEPSQAALDTITGMTTQAGQRNANSVIGTPITMGQSKKDKSTKAIRQAWIDAGFDPDTGQAISDKDQ